LRLVGPPPGLDAAEARALAYGAWDVLDGARVSPTLREATADATLVVGTTGWPCATSPSTFRRTRRTRPSTWPRPCWSWPTRSACRRWPLRRPPEKNA